jgi:uncharacterized protein (TIGR02996 family)
MDLREAFLRDIADHPDDNTPRRVFADWLLDQGGSEDAEHARFIQLQCDRASSDEEETLLARLTARWHERFAPFTIREWQRGFITAIGLDTSPSEAARRLASWPEFLVVRRVEVIRPDGQLYFDPLPAYRLQELLDSPCWNVAEFLGRGNTFIVYGEELAPVLGGETLRRLCRSSAARSLRLLDLSTNFYAGQQRDVIDLLLNSELGNLDTLIWDYDSFDATHRLSDAQMRQLSEGLGCRVVADGRSVGGPRT